MYGLLLDDVYPVINYVWYCSAVIKECGATGGHYISVPVGRVYGVNDAALSNIERSAESSVVSHNIFRLEISVVS